MQSLFWYYTKCAHRIGKQDRIEDGIRYVYEMNYTKGSSYIILKNIIKDTLIVTNVTDIEMFENEGINVIENNVKSVETVILDWLKFNN